MRVANADASKWVIGPIPERPLTMPSQLEARSFPSGDRMPIPVMATRRLDMGSSLCSMHSWAARGFDGAMQNARGRNAAPGCYGSTGRVDGIAWRDDARPTGQARRPTSRLDVGLDVVDRLLHRGDLLGFLVGDLALELFFERHYQFDGVERIRAEVVDEGRACADLLVLDAQLFDHDLLDAFFDAAHWL